MTKPAGYDIKITVTIQHHRDLECIAFLIVDGQSGFTACLPPTEAVLAAGDGSPC